MSKTKLAIVIAAIIVLLVIGAVLIWYFVTHSVETSPTDNSEKFQQKPDLNMSDGSGTGPTDDFEKVPQEPKLNMSDGSGTGPTDDFGKVPQEPKLNMSDGSGTGPTDDFGKVPQEPKLNMSAGSGTSPTDDFEKGLQEPWLNMRLPKYLIPYHYKVELKPVLTPDATGLYWFNGSSEVYFAVNESTNIIMIHSSKLNYLRLEVRSSPDKTLLPINSFSFYQPNDYLIIELLEPLAVSSTYSLKTEYFGRLDNDTTGFYRSDYVNASGTLTSIAASQMEPYFAREVFPCFDEPGFKSTFDIGLWHDYSNFALSNMDLEGVESKGGGWKLSRFHTTPRMSTYLVAAVVCDFNLFENSSTTTDPSIQTRIFARPLQIEAGTAEYANTITPKLLEYFTNFFGVQYPLPKSDQIAVPGYDLATAMENWGLVIYKETTLLFNESQNTVFARQAIAEVVAHELSHQWFGNIISPIWWDEIWLNEGFATYALYLGVNEIEPTMRINDQFVTSELHRAMSIDALVNSRPIVAQDANTKDEIIALFDAIGFSKGACIIRMIRAIVGEAAFKLGLKNYINENKYGSVTYQQLFRYWEEAIEQTEGGSNPPVKFSIVMSMWVLQMGFPIVNIKRDPSNSNQVIVTQERFLLGVTEDLISPESPFDYTWIIPFWYATQNDMKANLTWILQGENTVHVPENEYIIGNYEVFGYYRVNYDTENWQRITFQLLNDHEAIEPKSRGQLIDDAFNLARAGRLPYDIALNLSKILRVDFNYITWKSAVDALSYIGKMLSNSRSYEYFIKYLMNLVTPSYKNFGWNIQNDHLQILQQVLVNSLACSLGNRKCNGTVKGMLHQWQDGNGNRQKAKNFKPVVYCQGLAYGEEKEWNIVWKTYKTEKDSHEKKILLDALACTKDPQLILRLLNFTRTGSYIQIHEGPSVLMNLCNNNHARDLVWDFLKREWDFVLKAYGLAVFNFRKLILTCASGFSTPQELKDLEMFVRANAGNMGYGSKTFDQAVELVQANVQWRKQHENFLLSWFKNDE